MIKLSILFLYRRIFPQQCFMYVLIIVGAFVVACSLTLVLGIILQYIPIQAIWDPKVNSTHIRYGVLALIMGITNVITDVIILILPVPLLWKLKISATRRRQLIITFALGGL